MTFPIFRLPYLAFKEVLLSMDFADLFLLTRISHRMKRIIKHEVPVRNHNLRIYFYERVAFEFGSTSSPNLKSVITLKEGKANPCKLNFDVNIGNLIDVHSTILKSNDRNKKPLLVFFWKNIIAGTRALYEEILDIFPMPISLAKIDIDAVGANYRKITNWINSIFPNCPEVQIEGGDCDFKACTYLLENIKSSNRVLFLMHTTPTFNKATLAVKPDVVWIKHGEWITVRQLQSMRGISITIDDVSFTDQDINSFFHALKSGSNPNLKALNLSFTRQENPLTMFVGLNAVEVLEAVWLFKLDKSRSCEVSLFSTDPEDFDPVALEVRILQKEENQ